MSVAPLTDDSSPRSWKGISSSDRAAARRTLLLDAAFDLLGTEGWSATTVRGVCRAARLNPRYFYQAFADLDDLLVAVFDRVIDELGAAIMAAVAAAGPDVAARTRAGLGAVADFVAGDRRRARILYAEALGHDRLNRRRVDAMQQFVDALATPGRRPASKIAAHFAVGGFTNLLVSWLDGRIDVTLARVVEDATAMVLAAGDAAAPVTRPRR